MNSDSDDIIDPNMVGSEDEDYEGLNEEEEELGEEGDFDGEEEEDINEFDDEEEEGGLQATKGATKGKGRTLATNDADLEDDLDEVVRKKIENKLLMLRQDGLEEEVNMGKFDENEEQIIEQIQNERMTAQKFFDLATGKIQCRD